jgi:hypothetical protein
MYNPLAGKQRSPFYNYHEFDLVVALEPVSLFNKLI